jgi:NADH-quinone oxidoreductase subunit L
MSVNTLCLLLVLTPFLGFVINGIGFKKIPSNLAGIISTVAVLISFVCSLLLLKQFSGQTQIVKLFDWISVGALNIPFSFQIDQLSLLMLLIITGIGTLIHLYSMGYMHHDEGMGKFFAFLNLFIISMLLLVLGSNYVIMFIGWEGVGLCSYLLIGFWNKNTNYGNAARKAFIMNRIGDLGFLIGIFLIINHFGSVEYSEVFANASKFSINSPAMIAITACLFIGAMGKSAQVPLYTWLPDAMAGPTPVSALIHAATMVTAGIYMVVRSNVLYTLAPSTLAIVGIVGLITALFAASIGLFQNDIKKVLAYSTVSQLGYMFLGLGMMAYTPAMFHVMTHAFFKALLFLGAGSVIHGMSGEQDIRNMGGLKKHLPITFFTFLLGTIAIAGIPPFAGFFSKDEILMHVFEHNKLMWALAVVGSLMTSFYMFRLLFLTFFGEFRGTKEQLHHLHESPKTMTIPLMILAFFSVIGGFFNRPEILGGNAVLAHFLDPIYAASKALNPTAFEGSHLTHSQEFMLMGVSIAAALIAFLAAYFMFNKQNSVPVADAEMTGIKDVVYNKYYIDEVYNAAFVNPLKNLSKTLGGFFEEKVIGGIATNANFVVNGAANLFRQIQTGKTGLYMFGMVSGIVLIFAGNFSGKILGMIKNLLQSL